MKQILPILLILVLSVTGFVSCKKGENDPAFSLRSRDKKIIGTWKLEKMDSKKTITLSLSDTNQLGQSFLTDRSFTIARSVLEGQMTETIDRSEESNESGVPISYNSQIENSDTYSLEIVLEKNQEARITTLITKKTRVQTSAPSVACGQFYTPTPSDAEDFLGVPVYGLYCDGLYDYTVNGSNLEYSSKGSWKWMDGKKNKVILSIDRFGTFYIDRLAKDELVLTMNETTTDDQVSSSVKSIKYSTSDTGKWTFKK